MSILFGMHANLFSVLNSSSQPMARIVYRLFSQFVRRCCRTLFYTTIAMIFTGVSVGILLGLLIAATLYRANSEPHGRVVNLESPVILSTVKISSVRNNSSTSSNKQVKATQLTRKLRLGSKEEFRETRRENQTAISELNSNSNEDFTEFSPYFVQAPPLEIREKVKFSFGGGSAPLLSDTGLEDWKSTDPVSQRNIYSCMSSRASREIRQSFSDDSDIETREDQPLLDTRSHPGFNTTAELSPNSQIEFYSRFRLPSDTTNNPLCEDINADGYTISPRHHKSGSVSSNHYFLSIN